MLAEAPIDVDDASSPIMPDNDNDDVDEPEPAKSMTSIRYSR